MKVKTVHVKMSPEELQQYLIFKHRGSRVEPKKGKGTKYNRSKECKIPKEF